MSIGKRIAGRRKELGMTQEMLAEKLSLSAQAVSRWENGWNLPDIENIARIAAVLKMSSSELIGENRSSYEWELREQLFSEEHMFTRVKTVAELSNLKETYKALYYMREQHNGQFRKKQKYTDAKIPYIVHPLMMACHALSMGLVEDDLLAVILLHDVCEDCGVSPEELPFSEPVRTAVDLLTKRPLERTGGSKSDMAAQKEEYTRKYYEGIKTNRLAAMTKVIDRCNNVSTMAQAFNDRKLTEYIEETETYVMPVLSVIKKNWMDYNNAIFLIKYQMLSVLESLKIMIKEK